MWPIAHGIDIVDIAEFARTLSLASGSELHRYFTENEVRDAGAGVTRAQRLAGRLATKEAVMKALGVGWGDGISFVDVETVTSETGAPSIKLHRRLAEVAGHQGVVKWLVSTSHVASLAVASVVGVGADTTD